MSVWTIVLAEGHAGRLQKQIEEWFETPCPKQFCAFCGTRSMLSHTLHRATRIADEERIVTIVSKDHRCFLDHSLPGRCLEQPSNRGTGVGVFLAVTEILAEDPDATAVILPADHFVFPEDRFVEQIEETIRLADSFPRKLVLSGIKAEGPETDHDWVEPGRAYEHARRPIHGTREVNGLHAKPSPQEAVEWWRSGFYWNTRIVTARLKGLWELGWQLVPSVVYRFNQYLNILYAIQDGAIGVDEKELFLSLVYEDIPTTDLVSQVLARASNQSLFFTLRDLYWSDWGRPERILETIERFGLKANFRGGFHEGPKQRQPQLSI